MRGFGEKQFGNGMSKGGGGKHSSSEQFPFEFQKGKGSCQRGKNEKTLKGSDWFICYFRVLGKSFRGDFWRVLTCFPASFRSIFRTKFPEKIAEHPLKPFLRLFKGPNKRPPCRGETPEGGATRLDRCHPQRQRRQPANAGAVNEQSNEATLKHAFSWISGLNS